MYFCLWEGISLFCHYSPEKVVADFCHNSIVGMGLLCVPGAEKGSLTPFTAAFPILFYGIGVSYPEFTKDDNCL